MHKKTDNFLRGHFEGIKLTLIQFLANVGNSLSRGEPCMLVRWAGHVAQIILPRNQAKVTRVEK